MDSEEVSLRENPKKKSRKKSASWGRLKRGSGRGGKEKDQGSEKSTFLGS